MWKDCTDLKLKLETMKSQQKGVQFGQFKD